MICTQARYPTSEETRVAPMGTSMIQDITAVIKTFERPNELDRVIQSLRGFYPDLKIIVTDDSRIPYPRNDVDYHVMPYDSGLSAGRNLLIGIKVNRRLWRRDSKRLCRYGMHF
jgi:hypothetical protein